MYALDFFLQLFIGIGLTSALVTVVAFVLSGRARRHGDYDARDFFDILCYVGAAAVLLSMLGYFAIRLTIGIALAIWGTY